MKMMICENCSGTGQCPMCNGNGIDLDLGEACGCCFSSGECPECGGVGEVEEDDGN